MPSDPQFAKLFRNGQSQAVRLPKEFRFEGDRVRVKRLGDGVLLQPAAINVQRFFDSIDACRGGGFMSEGREQPPMPARDIRFD